LNHQESVKEEETETTGEDSVNKLKEQAIYKLGKLLAKLGYHLVAATLSFWILLVITKH
jgi:hypothetical protein